jgi:hypothetical protein
MHSWLLPLASSNVVHDSRCTQRTSPKFQAVMQGHFWNKKERGGGVIM